MEQIEKKEYLCYDNCNDKEWKTGYSKEEGDSFNKIMNNLENEGKLQRQNTDNPHDKGYKRIFSIKKNYLDFIKKYIGFDWMIELTEKD